LELIGKGYLGVVFSLGEDEDFCEGYYCEDVEGEAEGCSLVLFVGFHFKEDKEIHNGNKMDDKKGDETW
jgi:hypothetical protein